MDEKSKQILENVVLQARRGAIASVETSAAFPSYDDRKRRIKQAYEELGTDGQKVLETLLPEIVDAAFISLLDELSAADFALQQQAYAEYERPPSLKDIYEDEWLPRLRQKAKEGFWNVGITEERYTDPYPTTEEIRALEAVLGYKLPQSYLALMRTQNGGWVKKNCFRLPDGDTIHFTGLFGLGQHQPSTLGGELGSRFWMEEWEYPDIGVYFADFPSGGHQLLALDYRKCGPQGEPSVVYVDQDDDFSITELTPTFAEFVAGLVSEDGSDDE